MRDEIPQPNWTLERLRAFCQSTSRKWAKDAWLIGRAINLAEKKVRDAGGNWTQWQIDACPGASYKTIRRWCQLARLVDERDLDNVRLTEMYEKTGLLNRKKKPAAPPQEQQPEGEPPAHAPQDRPTLAVVKADGHPPAEGPPEPLHDGVIQLREQPNLPDDLAFLVAKLHQVIDEVERTKKRSRLWKGVDVAALRHEIRAVKKRLTWLEQNLPRKAAS